MNIQREVDHWKEVIDRPIVDWIISNPQDRILYWSMDLSSHEHVDLKSFVLIWKYFHLYSSKIKFMFQFLRTKNSY